MIPGKAFTRNGASADGDYIYFVNEDLLKYQMPRVNTNATVGDTPTLSVGVVKQDSVLDTMDIRIDSQDFYSSSFLDLPFRVPFMMKRGNIFFSDTTLAQYNTDFDSSSVAYNNGYMVELFMNDAHIKKYMEEYKRFSKRRNLDATFPIDSQRLTSPAVGLFHMYSRGAPTIDHYPTSLSLQSFKSGANNFVYITYVGNFRVLARSINFWGGRNHYDSLSGGSWYYWAYSQNWYDGLYNPGTKSYALKDIEFRWSVPIITRWLYSGVAKRFVFIDLSSPYSVYSNKIDPSIGTNKSWNTKLVPYNTTQIGDIGTLNLPSANRCVANTYMDTDNSRLVTVTAYGGEQNTWPDVRVDITYNSTSSALTFVPTKQATYNLQGVLRGMRQAGHIDNISNIDVTKWQNYYIIAVSYDLKYKDKDVRVGTALLKVDSTVADPIIEWFTNVKGAAFGAVQGLSGGSML